MFEVVVVSSEDEFDAFFPVLEAEGAGAAGVAPEVFAVSLYFFAGYDGAVDHAELSEEGCEGLFEVYFEGGVVGCVE